jgi:hypothetical protein
VIVFVFITETIKIKKSLSEQKIFLHLFWNNDKHASLGVVVCVVQTGVPLFSANNHNLFQVNNLIIITLDVYCAYAPTYLSR